jgi:GNAT superfamily N-acetyltransferase
MQRSWAGEEMAHGFVPATEEQIRASLGPFCLVAIEDCQAVGFVSAVRRDGEATAVMPAGPYLEIEHLYVVPELRRRGIGKALIDRVLAEAKALGIQHASMYSAVKDLRRVMRFYEQAGFESWYVRMFRKL